MAHYLIVSFEFDPVTNVQHTEQVVRYRPWLPFPRLTGGAIWKFWFDNEYSLRRRRIAVERLQHRVHRRL